MAGDLYICRHHLVQPSHLAWCLEDGGRSDGLRTARALRCSCAASCAAPGANWCTAGSRTSHLHVAALRPLPLRPAPASAVAVVSAALRAVASRGRGLALHANATHQRALRMRVEVGALGAAASFIPAAAPAVARAEARRWRLARRADDWVGELTLTAERALARLRPVLAEEPARKTDAWLAGVLR